MTWRVLTFSPVSGQWIFLVHRLKCCRTHDRRPAPPDELHSHKARPLSPDTHGRDAAGAWQGVPELHPVRGPWSQLRPRAHREHHLDDPAHRQRLQHCVWAPWLHCHEEPRWGWGWLRVQCGKPAVSARPPQGCCQQVACEPKVVRVNGCMSCEDEDEV